MAIPVKLQTFEGPLDLLLHLIEKNKIDIYDIPIVEITDQYMEYISQFPGETLDEMSEFLVMAATLLDIKSRMLLPPEEKKEDENTDPREELTEKLLEYKMYKYLSCELRSCMEGAAGHYYKKAAIPPEVASYREPADVDELLDGMTLGDLYTVFQDIMRRREVRSDPAHSKISILPEETIQLGEVMQFVGKYIFEKRNCTFREILRQHPGKQYKIAAFLTILELMKEGMAEVEQPEICADISLSWAGDNKGADLNKLAADYE